MTALIEYDPIELLYDNEIFSYVQTAETAPSFCVDEDGVLWYRYPTTEQAGWVSIGELSEYSLTKDGLQNLFALYNPNSYGMHETAEMLYRECSSAWRASYVHPATGSIAHYTVMQRKNGDFLLLYSFCSADTDGTLQPEVPRWVFKLSETANGVTLPARDTYRIAYAYAGSPAPNYNVIHQIPYADHSIETVTNLSELVDPDRFKQASAIPVLRFASADELKQFRYDYRDAFVFDDSLGDQIPAFDYAVRTFGDSEALFRDNVLLVVCINAPSDSHVYSVSQITAENGVLAVDISCYVPELCTDDEISHFVLIAVPRMVTEQTDAILALLEDVP